jgi:hypothetical protein
MYFLPGRVVGFGNTRMAFQFPDSGWWHDLPRRFGQCAPVGLVGLPSLARGDDCGDYSSMGNGYAEAACVAVRFRRAFPLLGKYACMATVPTSVARTSPPLRLHRHRNSHDNSAIDVFGDRSVVEEAFGWKEFRDRLKLELA